MIPYTCTQRSSRNTTTSFQIRHRAAWCIPASTQTRAPVPFAGTTFGGCAVNSDFGTGDNSAYRTSAITGHPATAAADATLRRRGRSGDRRSRSADGPPPPNATSIDPAEPDYNPTVQFFTAQTPPVINQRVVSMASDLNQLDLNKLLEGGVFFEYAGSLTAPPCAEIVKYSPSSEIGRAHV